MSQQASEASNRPTTLRYASLFAAFHFPIALAIGYVVTLINHNPGGGLGIILVLSAAYLVGWRFAVRERRLLTTEEMWRLIGACTIYLVLFDALGALANQERLAALTPKWWVGLIIWTLVADVFSLWLSFRVIVRKPMLKWIEKAASRAA